MNARRRSSALPWGPMGSFPALPPNAPLSQSDGTRGDVSRVAAERERIWGMQQQLCLPHGELSALVLATLETLHATAQAVGMAAWVEMLWAIQHGIDGCMEQARAKGSEVGSTGLASVDLRHEATALVIAHFYLGLLDVSPLNRTEAAHLCSLPITLTTRMNAHRHAQKWTKEALDRLQRSALKPPREFAPLVALINVYVHALPAMPDPPDGCLHMITPATVDAPHSCECLFAYGLTQLCKGRPDRASLVMAVCKDNTLCQLEDERRAVLADWLALSSEGRATLAKTAGQEASCRSDRIQRALAFISSQIDTKFTATELANVCGVTARTISENFRAVFHKTVLACVTEERMRFALTLLQDRSLSMDMVAAKVGFQSSCGFAKGFFRTYGHMPVRPMHDA